MSSAQTISPRRVSWQAAATAPEPTPVYWRRAAAALLWVMVFCIPWSDMVLLPFDVQANRLLTVLGVLIWLYSVWKGEKVRKHRFLHVLMLLFLCWAAVGGFTSPNPPRTFRRVMSYAQLLALGWVLYQMVRGPAELRRLFQAYILGCLVPWAGLMASVLKGQATGDGRYTCPGLDPNDLTSTLAVGVPLAWYLLFTTRRRRWLNGFYMAAAASAVVLTGSRGGLLTLLLATAYPLLAAPLVNRRTRGAIAAVGLLIAGGVVWRWDMIASSRLTTITQQVAARDMNGRFEVWSNAYEMFLENPVLGLGAGTFASTVGGARATALAAHNTFLGVLVEHGLPGLLLLTGIPWALWRGVRRLSPLEARLWKVLLAAWATTALSLSWENREVTWLVFGLCAAHVFSAQARRRPAARPATAPCPGFPGSCRTPPPRWTR